jgi:hypothetical protein
MYFCITYISKAKKQMSKLELNAILDESIIWNRDHNITGMLLYIESELLNHKEGRFIQALEGKEADVREVFKMIKKDDRHFNISLLSETPLITRNFPKWSMGFKSIHPKKYLNSGRFELNAGFLKYDPVNALNPALDFIKQFYSLNMNSGNNNGTL